MFLISSLRLGERQNCIRLSEDPLRVLQFQHVHCPLRNWSEARARKAEDKQGALASHGCCKTWHKNKNICAESSRGALHNTVEILAGNLDKQEEKCVPVSVCV